IAGVTPSRRLGLGRGADIQRPWCSLEASHGGLRHLAYGRFVHKLHLLPPPGGGGVVGVEYLAEALCGRDGGAHDLRIGGRKREVRGGGRRRDSGNAGHPARARTLPRTSASNRSGMRESRQSKWSFQSAACAAIAHSFTAGPPQRPLHTCTRSTLTQTSHALCDIRAILVGIVRKSWSQGRPQPGWSRSRTTKHVQNHFPSRKGDGLKTFRATRMSRLCPTVGNGDTYRLLTNGVSPLQTLHIYRTF